MDWIETAQRKRERERKRYSGEQRNMTWPIMQQQQQCKENYLIAANDFPNM